MVYVVDTNVLLRFAERRHTLHGIARTAIRKLRQDGHSLRVTPQNCGEWLTTLVALGQARTTENGRYIND